MSGLEIVFLLIGLVFLGGTFTVLEMLINKKQRDEQKKNDEEFSHMMTIFDEMGYAPTTFCEEPDKEAKDFKNALIEIYYRRG